jgi:hypothetical protein
VSSVRVRNQNSLFSTGMLILESDCRKVIVIVNVFLKYRCSARDWDRIRITWGNPQSGCTDICSYSKRATVGVRAPYATRQNSGMKRIKCG